MPAARIYPSEPLLFCYCYLTLKFCFSAEAKKEEISLHSKTPEPLRSIFLAADTKNSFIGCLCWNAFAILYSSEPPDTQNPVTMEGIKEGEGRGWACGLIFVCADFNLFAHFVQEACKSSVSKGVSNPVVEAAARLHKWFHFLVHTTYWTPSRAFRGFMLAAIAQCPAGFLEKKDWHNLVRSS